jgi:hypothetical protein
LISPSPVVEVQLLNSGGDYAIVAENVGDIIAVVMR